MIKVQDQSNTSLIWLLGVGEIGELRWERIKQKQSEISTHVLFQ